MTFAFNKNWLLVTSSKSTPTLTGVYQNDRTNTEQYFVFWEGGLLQLPIWYGLWFIIEDLNWTCKRLNSVVIWWMDVS